LKGFITIDGNSFGTDSSAIKVHLLDSNSLPVYELNVDSVSDTEIIATLGGGHVGTYTLTVEKIGYGYSINTKTFKYQIIIDSVSPSSGSINGGTTITISGSNFSTNLNDNVVFLSYTLEKNL
jgi:hypothetical protein